jgi:hypothetical protein
MIFFAQDDRVELVFHDDRVDVFFHKATAANPLLEAAFRGEGTCQLHDGGKRVPPKSAIIFSR